MSEVNTQSAPLNNIEQIIQPNSEIQSFGYFDIIKPYISGTNFYILIAVIILTIVFYLYRNNYFNKTKEIKENISDINIETKEDKELVVDEFDNISNNLVEKDSYEFNVTQTEKNVTQTEKNINENKKPDLTQNILDLNNDYHILDENNEPFRINLKEMIQLHKYLLEQNDSQQKSQKNIYEQILLQQQLQQEIQQQMSQLENTKNVMSKQLNEITNKNNSSQHNYMIQQAQQQQVQQQVQQQQVQQQQVQQQQVQQQQVQQQAQQQAHLLAQQQAQLLAQQQQAQLLAQQQQAQLLAQQQQAQHQQKESNNVTKQNKTQIHNSEFESDSEDLDLSDNEINTLKKQLIQLQNENNNLLNN
jgi:hypothetical protein